MFIILFIFSSRLFIHFRLRLVKFTLSPDLFFFALVSTRRFSFLPDLPLRNITSLIFPEVLPISFPMDLSLPIVGNNSSSDGANETDGPHGALFLVLAYLRLPELLAFQMVCRAFRDAIAGDNLLWRRFAVEPPLSRRLTDDGLLSITSRADGKLESLALLDCWKISDAGLALVADRNPGIRKLCVPGCTYLTADGILRVAKQLSNHEEKLEQVQLRGLPNITKEHLDCFKAILCKNTDQQILHSTFYSNRRSLPFISDNDAPIDVDQCPKCKNIGLVFDCTKEDCRLMKDRWTECRGCLYCIARCETCGGCIEFDDLREETVCSHLLCIHCWLRLPKCNMCNKPYCIGHSNFLGGFPITNGFVCEWCRDLETSSHDYFADSSSP